MDTTCQICGRIIKSKNDLIAHHGYLRPGLGLQTKSCYGARNLPYEKSKDLIPGYIKILEDIIKNIREQIENIKNKKVDIIFFRHVISPEDPSYKIRSEYEISCLEFNIRNIKREVDILNQRLKNWKFIK